MHPASTAVLVLVLVASCRTAESPYEQPVPGGLLVRVVDAAGGPVAGAEVRAQGTGAKPHLVLLDELLAGSLRRAEEYGSSWRTDQRGEVRVAGGMLHRHVVARAGDRFGAAHVGAREPSELVIAIEREESVTVRCVGAQGRPAVGSLVWIATTPAADEVSDRDGEVFWCQRVTAADGTLELPHAQLWRALQRAGSQVSVAGFVWWGEEMGQESTTPFPAPHDEPLVFTVSPHGFLDVRVPTAAVPADSEVWLRWLNPPPDPDDPDDVPEISFGASEAWNLAIPLGARFEAVLEVEGALDSRVQFDGPTRQGQRVAVVLGPMQPASRVTGRLVDADGSPMAWRTFDAWLEHDAVRVEAEEDWLVTDDHGRFAFDLVPGGAGTLCLRVDPDVRFEGALTERLELGGLPREPVPSIGARHAFATPLPAGDIALGDLVCGPER